MGVAAGVTAQEACASNGVGAAVGPDVGEVAAEAVGDGEGAAVMVAGGVLAASELPQAAKPMPRTAKAEQKRAPRNRHFSHIKSLSRVGGR